MFLPPRRSRTIGDRMRSSRLLLVALAMPVALAAGDADGPAGHGELRALDRRIAEAESLLPGDAARLDALRSAAWQRFADDAERWLRDFQPWRGPVPADVAAFPAWYQAAVRERIGWSPTEPLGPEARAWAALRREEHVVYARYEALRVALLRLRRLRDRLRRQLDLPPLERP